MIECSFFFVYAAYSLAKIVGAGKPYHVTYIKDSVRDGVVQDMGLRSYDILQCTTMDNQCAIDFVVVDIRHRFPEGGEVSLFFCVYICK